MNELIATQRIRKRKRPRFPGIEAKNPFARRRSDRPAAAERPRLSPRAAVALSLLPLLVVLVLGAQAVAAALAVRNLDHAADPAYSRELRAFAGMKGGVPSSDQADAPPFDLTETFRFERYTVKAGDSLSSIAARFSVSVGSIVASNGVSNAKRLVAGSILKIPNMNGLPYKVRKGDSLSRIAAAWSVPLEAILDANDLQTAVLVPGSTLFLPGARMRTEDLNRVLGDFFAYPLRGRLTSAYGWRADPFTGVRRFHAAIDLAADVGTPVRAAAEGRVSALGYNSVYGKYVILTHSGGYQTWYAHLNEFRTEKGAWVAQGTRIGDAGNTGYSTGSHLHFAVFRNGRALNPLSLLPKR